MRRVKTLKKNYEFKNVLDNGKYFVNRQVIIYVKKNNFGYNRIGIAIGSKIGNAVVRNHLKRLIREAYYKNLKIPNQLFFYDIVVIWNKKANIDDASFFCIDNDFRNSFKKLEFF